MGDAGTLSVVIPVYNGAAFLATAVQNVEGQGDPNVEIIVVDDGSSDATAAEAESLGGRIRYLHQSNRGPSAARNAGLAVASGELVAFLDVDDRWRQGKTSLQRSLLERSGADATWGRTQVMMREHGDPPAFLPSGDPLHYPQLGAFLFRMAVFERVGTFDEDLRIGEDVDVLARAEDSGCVVERHPDVVLDWYRHESNMTNDARARVEFVRSIKRSLDRRRSS